MYTRVTEIPGTLAYASLRRAATPVQPCAAVLWSLVEGNDYLLDNTVNIGC